MIKVRAKFPKGGFGFYTTRRRDGDEFEIAKQSELAAWMEVVEEPKKRGRKPKPIVIDEEGGE